MIKHILFFSLYLMPLLCLSQTTLSGQTIHAKTQKPIPFVNIGVVYENIGTVSDAKGFFRLSIEKSLSSTDSIKISSVGYKTLKFSATSFPEILSNTSHQISLEEDIRLLHEIIVDGTTMKTKVRGNKTRSKLMRAHIGSNALGSELGVKINLKNRPAFLESFHTYILNNTFDSVTFRLNIYSKEDGLPKENILQESILVKTAIKEGPLKVDLSGYNIFLDEDFIITLEWIAKYPKEGAGFLGFPVGLLNSAIIARLASQGEWRKYKGFGVGFYVTLKQ